MKTRNVGVQASVSMAIALMWALLPVPEASAETCCPSSCVPSGYGGGCWQNGTTNACTPIPCGGPPQAKGSGPSAPGGTPATSPPSTQSNCVSVVSPANITVETDACVGTLTANARLFGCLFEDAAGKKEDFRTGMTCVNRQAALAAQCTARCKQFAIDYHSHICETPTRSRDDFWKATFGSIGGEAYGSARVPDCGPKLPSVNVKALPGPGSNRDQQYLKMK